MKQLVMLAGFAVILLGLGGCGQQNEKISGQPLTPPGGQELQSKPQEEVLPKVWDGEPPDEGRYLIFSQTRPKPVRSLNLWLGYGKQK